MMRFQEILITRCDGSGPTNAVADFLVSPLRGAMGGRSFKVIVDKEGIPCILGHEKGTDSIEELVRKICCVILTIVFCIPVAIGVVLKWNALKDDTVSVNYNIYLNEYLEHPRKITLFEGLMRRPVDRKRDLEKEASVIPDKEVVSRFHAQLSRLSNGSALKDAKEGFDLLWSFGLDSHEELWKGVKYPVLGANKLKAQLKSIVFLLENTRDPTEHHKDLIMNALRHLDMKEAIKCPPTRIECTELTIGEFQDVTAPLEIQSIRDRILKILQIYKEEVIEELDRKMKGSQWHIKNYARLRFGRELGLDSEAAENDGYAILSYQVTDDQILDAVQAACSPPKFVKCLRDALIQVSHFNDHKIHKIREMFNQQDSKIEALIDEEFRLVLCNYIDQLVGKKLETTDQMKVARYIEARTDDPDAPMDPNLKQEQLFHSVYCAADDVDRLIPTDQAYEWILEDLGIIGW